MAKQTGTDTDAGVITYYDPDKGRYGIREWSADDPFAHKDDFEWTMVDGQRTYTLKTDTPSKTVPVGDNNWDKVYQGTPGYEDLDDIYIDDSREYDWATGDSRQNITGGINREAGPSDTPQGYVPVDLTPGYLPQQPVNPPTNSEIAAGLRPDPTAPEGGWDFSTTRPSGGWTITDRPLQDGLWGPGGTPGRNPRPPSGVDPTGPVMGGGEGPISRFGFEGYGPNQQFYQEQFAQMRERDQAERQRAMAANMRAQEIQDTPVEATDPWGWVEGGLAPVYVGGAEEGFDPNQMILNPNYGLEGGMTNNEIINRMGGIFDEAESNLLNKHRQTPGNMWDTSQYLGSGYDNVSGQWGAGAGGSFAELMNKILNNAYVRAGDAPSPGGVMVPPGYASPINA